MRRSHDSLPAPTLSADPLSGELHRRHTVTADGFYRGQRLFESPAERKVDPEVNPEVNEVQAESPAGDSPRH